MVKEITKMLADEESFILRSSEEATVDFAAIKAEIRAECLREVLRVINATHPSS